MPSVVITFTMILSFVASPQGAEPPFNIIAAEQGSGAALEISWTNWMSGGETYESVDVFVNGMIVAEDLTAGESSVMWMGFQEVPTGTFQITVVGYYDGGIYASGIDVCLRPRVFGFVPTIPQAQCMGAQVPVLGYDFPNDALFPNQWSLHNDGQFGGVSDEDLDLPQAWDLETGRADVIVVTIDTGTNWDHPDLRNQLTPGFNWDTLMPDPGGYSPFVSISGVRPWDPTVYDPNDPTYQPETGGGLHGPRTSGIIGAERNNGIGIAGIAGGSGQGDGVRIMPMFVTIYERTISAAPIITDQVYPASGPTDDMALVNCVADCLEYATYMKTELGAPIFVVNSTIKGQFPGPPALIALRVQNAIDAARSAGILFVQSAGNAVGECEGLAELENLIAVPNTTRTEALYCESSTCGDADLAAPGSQILTTHLNGDDAFPGVSGVWGYKSNNHGTSWSSPHVTGIAALIFSRYPGITVDLVEESLFTTAELTSELAMDPSFTGFGRVNAYRALLYAGGYPDLPGDTTGDGAVTLLDATVIARYLVTGSYPFQLPVCVMDVNSDGAITTCDCEYLLDSLGTGPEPTVGCPFWP